MKNIRDILNSNNKFYKTKDKKDFIIDSIVRNTGVLVHNDFISFSGDTIFLSVNPKDKNSILKNKRAILDSLLENKEMAFYKNII